MLVFHIGVSVKRPSLAHDRETRAWCRSLRVVIFQVRGPGSKIKDHFSMPEVTDEVIESIWKYLVLVLYDQSPNIRTPFFKSSNNMICLKGPLSKIIFRIYHTSMSSLVLASVKMRDHRSVRNNDHLSDTLDIHVFSCQISNRKKWQNHLLFTHAIRINEIVYLWKKTPHHV